MSRGNETKTQKCLVSIFLSANHLLQNKKQTASYQQALPFKDATAYAAGTKFVTIESQISSKKGRNPFTKSFDGETDLLPLIFDLYL